MKFFGFKVEQLKSLAQRLKRRIFFKFSDFKESFCVNFNFMTFLIFENLIINPFVKELLNWFDKIELFIF